MKVNEYLNKSMPTIRRLIDRAEGRILETTGIKLVLDIKEITDLNNADNKLLEWLIRCCDVWQISYSDLIIKKRDMDIVTRRFVASLLLHTKFNEKVSKGKMAVLLGYKDHSSMYFSVEKAQDFLDTEDKLFMKWYLPVKHLFDEAETK